MMFRVTVLTPPATDAVATQRNSKRELDIVLQLLHSDMLVELMSVP